jgi:hypothetical protein
MNISDNTKLYIKLSIRLFSTLKAIENLQFDSDKYFIFEDDNSELKLDWNLTYEEIKLKLSDRLPACPDV